MMAKYNVLKLATTFAVGLLSLVPAADFSAGVSIPRQSNNTSAPQPAIAIKLSPAFSPSSRKRQDFNVTGAELVESLVQKALPNLTSVAKRDGQLKAVSLFNNLSPDILSNLVKEAEANDPTYKGFDFGAWFQVQLPETASAKVNSLLATLAGYPEVASCQPLSSGPSLSLPAVQPNDDPLFPQQSYLKSSDRGINAEYAWKFPGGDGAGARVIDVERAWKLDHPDLVAANITILSGFNSPGHNFGNLPHGTAVLGIMLMVDNTIGGVGVAPAAKANVVSVIRGDNPNDNRPEAIADAARFLSAGDVMLLEMQVNDADNTQQWPVEVYDAEFEVIRAATAKGIVVVEPAGNGVLGDKEGLEGVNLDGRVIRPGDTAPGKAFLNRSSPDFRDSGAIIVAASTSTVPRKKMPWSNYGGRVDVHAWGQNITTASCISDGFSSCEDAYIQFDGTSGAAPIVAGAALSVQGMLAAKGKKKLSSTQMRDLIKIGGTKATDPSSGNIGVMPDLKALIDGGHLK